jgi:hypothetical protein
LPGALSLALTTSWSASCKGHEPEAASSVTSSELQTPGSSPTASGSTETSAGSNERDRQCELTIEAPLQLIRAVVTDYDRYATTLPRFGRSKVLKRTAGTADVYLQVPILHGAGHLWAVARFVGPIVDSDGERVEGTYLGQGNVSAFHCLWAYSRIDETHTRMHLGLLLLPKIPLPESVIDSELRGACRDALDGVRAHTEASRGATPAR